MDFDQLITFQAVYHTLNFSRAAEQLNVTQPTVTARIQVLETELNVKLFNRIGKRLRISEEGKTFYPYTKKILDQLKEAKDALYALKQSTIKVAFAPGFAPNFIFDTIHTLQMSNHLATLVLEGEDTTEVLEKLKSGEVDLSFTRNANPTSDLMVEEIIEDKLIFIVGKHHKLAKKDIIVKGDLHHESMICYRRHTSLWQLIEEKLNEIENLRKVEVGSFEMIKSFVKNGWGFSIIPELYIKDQDYSNELCIKPFDNIENIPNKVTAIYKQDTENKEAIHLFIESFKNSLKNI